MFSLLLAIIYLAYISLGLPDSLIGAGWPAMHAQLGVPVSYAGLITMIISANTIISSLLSNRLNRRFGTGRVTAVSVMTTALGLFGFALAPSFSWLCVIAVPYGLGAGAVDAALNNYVALHYSTRQLNWLHMCWGLGAAISPNVMGFALTHHLGWRSGYLAIGIVQALLTIALFASLPLWHERHTATAPTSASGQLRGLPGLPQALIAFLAYCAIEGTAGIWAASYLVASRGVHLATAARAAALFYIGITVGRFIAGVIADRIGDRALIWSGIGVLATGGTLLLFPLPSHVAMLALLLIGIGCAPIYPTIIHQVPTDFGAANSQAVIGIEMASAYVGSTFAPPIFGWLAGRTSLGLYPVYLLVLTVVMAGAIAWQTHQLHQH